MEIRKQNENSIIDYELIYDKNKILDLMKRIASTNIIKRTSNYHSIDGENRLYARDIDSAYEMIDKCVDINGNKVFTNLSKDNIALRPGDGLYREVIFKATKNCYPMLFNYLKDILEGNKKGYIQFINYYKSIELVPYGIRESALLSRFKENVKVLTKIDDSLNVVGDLMTEMKRLNRERKENEDYDFNKLKDYYIEAIDLFKLRKLRKTEIYENAELQELGIKKHL